MTSAAIAFAEIEQKRPDLIEKIGLLFLAHPDTAPFWVAAGEAKGKERIRRMFLECARWPDDSKFTPRDMLTWHTARWAIVAKDAPPEVKAAAKAREGKPAGQALEALALNNAMVANPESSPAERALGLCWVFHIVGDLHCPACPVVSGGGQARGGLHEEISAFITKRAEKESHWQAGYFCEMGEGKSPDRDGLGI